MEEQLQSLVKSTVDEIQKVVGSCSLVGTPQVVGDTTLIPVTSTGFWFAGGGTHGEKKDKEGKEGEKYGTGGGASIKPIAMVIIDATGTRVESIKGIASTVEAIADKIPEMVTAIRGKK